MNSYQESSMVPKRQTDLQLQRAQNDLPSPGCLANIRRMKWIPTLILSLLIVGVAHAEGPDDQYLEIYNWITQADTFSQTGDSKHAIANYSLAQDGLKKLQSVYSTWNPDIVKFRLEYVAERLAAATKQLPPVIADASTNAPKTATRADLQQQAADLAEQVSTLAAEKAGLEKKLKEAFSLQPAPANSADLAKAQQEINALKKERDLLATTLSQERAVKTATVSEKEIAVASDELKSIHAQLDQAQKARTKLEAECADLKTKLAAKEAKPTKKQAEREIDQLCARVAALEASPIPYTPEEQALLKTGEPKPTSFHVAADATVLPKKGVHSVKDLPQGAGAMMADAQRLFVVGEYEKAEKKYIEVLRQDEKNVYVLTHLANAQLAQNHIEDCEKNVQSALTIDPDDAASLFLLGNLRLRQDKVDDALNALSRSASINPTNAVTQNSLGNALSRKGMDKAAETALRKALLLDPGFPEAHHNLAIIYATQKPPSMELARWHYKKALDLGQPKNPSIEKIFDATAGTAPAPATPASHPAQ